MNHIDYDVFTFDSLSNVLVLTEYVSCELVWLGIHTRGKFTQSHKKLHKDHQWLNFNKDVTNESLSATLSSLQFNQLQHTLNMLNPLWCIIWYSSKLIYHHLVKARIPTANIIAFISMELSINVTLTLISSILSRAFFLSSKDT